LGAMAAQAGRWRGSAWLLGLRRTKADGARWFGREGGHWACGSGSGKVGWVAWAGWQAKAEGVGGPAGKEKKKEIHSKLISRFRKMNKVFQVT
jgi:hypothetical protein